MSPDSDGEDTDEEDPWTPHGGCCARHLIVLFLASDDEDPIPLSSETEMDSDDEAVMLKDMVDTIYSISKTVNDLPYNPKKGIDYTRKSIAEKRPKDWGKGESMKLYKHSKCSLMVELGGMQGPRGPYVTGPNISRKATRMQQNHASKEWKEGMKQTKLAGFKNLVQMVVATQPTCNSLSLPTHPPIPDLEQPCDAVIDIDVEMWSIAMQKPKTHKCQNHVMGLLVPSLGDSLAAPGKRCRLSTVIIETDDDTGDEEMDELMNNIITPHMTAVPKSWEDLQKGINCILMDQKKRKNRVSLPLSQVWRFWDWGRTTNI